MKKALINTAVLAVALAGTFYVLTELILLMADIASANPKVSANALATALADEFFRAVQHEDRQPK